GRRESAQPADGPSEFLSLLLEDGLLLDGTLFALIIGQVDPVTLLASEPGTVHEQGNQNYGNESPDHEEYRVGIHGSPPGKDVTLESYFSFPSRGIASRTQHRPVDCRFVDPSAEGPATSAGRMGTASPKATTQSAPGDSAKYEMVA